MKLKQAVIALTALAQESRLRVFRLLVPAGEAGVAAGQIADQLGLPAATLTFHLKELAHAGLVESRREGRSIRYSLRCDAMRGLLNFLAHDCCRDDPELCCIDSVGCCGETKSPQRRPGSRAK